MKDIPCPPHIHFTMTLLVYSVKHNSKAATELEKTLLKDLDKECRSRRMSKASRSKIFADLEALKKKHAPGDTK